MKSKSAYTKNNASTTNTKKVQDIKSSALNADKSRLSSNLNHRNDTKQHRRSPSVLITGADQTTIATNSVAHVAAIDPSVKALVLQQQQQHETEVAARSRKEQQQCNNVKYNNLENNPTPIIYTEHDHNDSDKNCNKIYPSCSPEPSTSILHSQCVLGHTTTYLLNTPGSAANTTVANHQIDDDGTSVSEITTDAGYMVVNSGNELIKMHCALTDIATAEITENMNLLSCTNEFSGSSLVHHEQSSSFTVPNPSVEVSMYANAKTSGQEMNEKSEQTISSPFLNTLNLKELPDDVLQACYMSFLQEMESRRLYSVHQQSLNVPYREQITINNSLNNAYNEELSSIVDNCGGTMIRPHTSQSIEFPSKTSLPHELRKNVKRSKSGGSETAFIPSSVLGNTNSSTNTNHSGRKTPNSPFVHRFPNATGDSYNTHSHHLEKLNSSLEPEDLEVRNAFGTLVSASPNHSHPNGSSNVYQTSSPSYYHHNSFYNGVLLNASSVQNSSNNGNSASPVFNTSGSPRPNTSASVSANTSATVSPSALHSLQQRRPLSRGSGVIPPLHDELIEMRRNCLSCLPTSYKATSSIVQPAFSDLGGGTTSSKSNVKIAHTDLKTPKFKKALHGLLRYNTNQGLNINTSIVASTTDVNSHAVNEGSAQNMNSPIVNRNMLNSVNNVVSISKLPMLQQIVSSSSDDATAPLSPTSYSTECSEDSNKKDLVKNAGGLDQLLNRVRLQSKELVPDVNSAFDDCSVGSQSLRSVGSNRSSSKKKKLLVVK